MTATASPKAILWSDMLLLGNESMDAMHREFVDVVGCLQAANNETLTERLSDVIAHLEQHFHEEETWMRNTGYPAIECHVAEHAAVLASGRDVVIALTEGKTALCRRYADELASWFPGHADYLDAPLAQWLSHKRFGAVPVVLKRSAINSSLSAPTD